MGLNIGQIPASLAVRPDTTVARQPRREEEDAPALTRRVSDHERTQAGFGDNTLSPGGAALQALDVNLRKARQVVPTVEELREEFQARQAESERAMEARETATAEGRETPATEAREPDPEEAGPEEQSTRPAPAPQARAFEAQRYANGAPSPAPTVARLDVMA